MKNIIFHSSILSAIIWCFCYVLIEATPAIHFLLTGAFIGIIASQFMDERIQVSK